MYTLQSTKENNFNKEIFVLKSLSSLFNVIFKYVHVTVSLIERQNLFTLLYCQLLKASLGVISTHTKTILY